MPEGSYYRARPYPRPRTSPVHDGSFLAVTCAPKPTWLAPSYRLGYLPLLLRYPLPAPHRDRARSIEALPEMEANTREKW